MNLFGRRPLSLFCCIFLLVFLLNRKMYHDRWSWIIFCSLVGISLLLVVGIKLFRSRRILLFMVLLCCLTVLFSYLYSFFTVVLPQRRATDYVGERGAVCYIIAEDHVTEYSSCYLVKIESIEGEKTDIQASLLCPKGITLSPQDRLAARFLIFEGAELWWERSNALLTLELEAPESAYVQRAPEDRAWSEILFSDSGIRILSNRVRNGISEQLKEYLGEEKGALASGFFLGDRSDISATVTRNFQRSGASHMMAVSGMHISLLFGILGLLLQKVYVSKKIRCAVISVLALLFLCLTGFSMSACRSVFMLYAVYLNYLFYEDHDSVTALFVSVTVILLISPWAVADLGLWMSFLATLGLLTVYPICEARIPAPTGASGERRRVLRFFRSILLIAVMTLIANLFLLPIYWVFFKEISLVSLLCNIVLSPISTLFLAGVPILLIVGQIPLFGGAVRFCVQVLAEWILDLTELFSKIPHATLSLRYPFFGWIVLVFTVSMTVLLLLRLRRKWLLAVPPALAGVAFLICLTWYLSVYDAPELTYYNDGSQNELLIVEEKNQISVCDISGGGWRGYSAIQTAMEKSVATELDTLLLTHYHKGHSTMLEMASQTWIIRQIYLPIPTESEEAEIAKDLWEIGMRYDISIQFYEEGEAISLLGSADVQACRGKADEQGAFVVNFAGKELELTYVSAQLVDPSVSEFAKASMHQGKRALLGCHDWKEELGIGLDGELFHRINTVIVSSDAMRQDTAFLPKDCMIVVPPSAEEEYALSFLFE